MRIFYDILPLTSHPGGISVYVENLIRGIKNHPGHEIFTGLPSLREKYHDRYENILKQHHLDIRSIKFRFFGRIAKYLPPYAEKYLNRDLRTPLDIVHATANFPISWFPNNYKKMVLTIHDVGNYHFDHPYNAKKDNDYFIRKVDKYLPLADHVITVSQFTKDELCKFTGFPNYKVDVVHLAPQWQEYPIVMPCNNMIIEKNGLKRGNYFLSVSTLSPRKNYENLLLAFKEFNKSEPDAKLVIVGRLGWSYDNILKLMESQRNNVVWVQECSVEELCVFYNNARAFFMVSWYEGFGIPVLEAMQNGCPVCFATGSSMDEIAEGAGLKVSPGDIQGITEAMSALWDDNILRMKLSKLGRSRSEDFSWNKTAEKTLDVYEKLIR